MSAEKNGSVHGNPHADFNAVERACREAGVTEAFERFRHRWAVAMKRDTERHVLELERCQRSRKDLQTRNALLTEHDDCKWRHQVTAMRKTLETQGRRVAELEMALGYQDNAEEDAATAKEWEPVLGDGLDV